MKYQMPKIPSNSDGSNIKNFNKIGGFTLIEVMIAIIIVIIGVLGIYALVPHILGAVAVNDNRFVASQLAKEGIEIIRNIRDDNYLESISNPANSWSEGLENCALSCEVDYTISSISDPVLPVWVASGNRLKINANGFYIYSNDPTLPISKFTRKITIIFPNDPNCLAVPCVMDVRVDIYWTKNTTFTTEITSLQAEERLYNWR